MQRADVGYALTHILELSHQALQAILHQVQLPLLVSDDIVQLLDRILLIRQFRFQLDDAFFSASHTVLSPKNMYFNGHITK